MGDSKKKSLKIPKGVIRIRKSKKDRQHNGQKKKDRQHNGQKKKDRQHNGQKKKDRQHNGQNQKEKGQQDKQRSTKHIHKIKDQVKRTPLKYYNLNIQKNTSEHRIKTE
jgi:TRAF3-interacting protein 1